MASHAQGVTVAQRVAEVLTEEEQHAWTPYDLSEAEPDLKKGPITSVWLKPAATGFIHEKLIRTPILQTQGLRTPISLPPPPPAPLPPYAQNAIAPSRLISEVAKNYTEEQKYDGVDSSFTLKLTIFLSIC